MRHYSVFTIVLTNDVANKYEIDNKKQSNGKSMFNAYYD